MAPQQAGGQRCRGQDVTSQLVMLRQGEEGMTRIRRLALTGLATLGLFAAGLASSIEPALAIAPEAPVTEAATTITATNATLNGELNPGTSATTGYYFAYSANGTCSEAFTTEPGAEATGKAIKVSTEVTGLIPSTEYTFCALATHLEGEVTESTSGLPLTFKTLGAAPSVDSESSSGTTVTAATLEAQINPNNQETTYVFEYATDEALIGATAVAGASPLPAGFGDQLAAVEVGPGLLPGTTYYYRVVATNATGPTEGAVQSFTTLAAPVATTAQAQNPSRTGATLSGTVDPGGAETTYYFAYIDQTGYEAAIARSAANPYAAGGVAAGGGVGADHAVHSVGPLRVGELAPGVTYHYAVVATNSVGTTIGPDVSFTTLPPTPPIAVTGAVENLTQLSATLTGTVDTRELQSTWWFEFGTSPYAGSLAFASASGSGATEIIASSFSNSLQPGTTYYYRAVATNADGTSYGAEQSFTTSTFPSPFAIAPPPPLVPYTTIAEILAREAPTSKAAGPSKPLTRAQKLAKALTACGMQPKKRRAACKAHARKQFGPAKAKPKKVKAP
jgi:hypothetical protein